MDNINICDLLEEYADILKSQGALIGAVGSLSERGYNVSSLEAQIQELEFEAAEVSSQIVQAFVDAKKNTVREVNREAEMARAFGSH